MANAHKTEINNKSIYSSLIDPKMMHKILFISFVLFSTVVLRTYAADLKHGTEFRDCDDCPVMVVIPKGENMLGDRLYDTGLKKSRMRPLHNFILERDIAVSKFEVTRKLYNSCVKEGVCKGEREIIMNIEKNGKITRFVTNKRTLAQYNHPVPVSWQDATEYAAWLSKKTGRKYRLLSYDEWEYVARGGTETIFWWGDEFKLDHEYCRDCITDNIEYKIMAMRERTLPVGLFKKNPYSLFDMLGNLEEWVGGCALVEILGVDGTDPKNCRFRRMRGGGYYSPLKKLIRPTNYGAADNQNINIKVAIRIAVEIN